VLTDEDVAQARPEIDAAIGAARIEHPLHQAGVAHRWEQEQPELALHVAYRASRVRLAIGELHLEFGVARHALAPAGRRIDAVAGRQQRLRERQALELAEAQLHRRARWRHVDGGHAGLRVELGQAGIEALVVQSQDRAGFAGAQWPGRAGIGGRRHRPVRGRLRGGALGAAARTGGEGGQ